MLVCEQELAQAIHVFFREAKIPRPSWLSVNRDLLLMTRVIPAFLRALEEIESVELCHNFDPRKVIQLYTEGWKKNDSSS